MLRKGIQSLKLKMRLSILQRTTMKRRRRTAMKTIRQKLKNQVRLYMENCSWLSNLMSFLETYKGGKNSGIQFLSKE